MSDKSYLKNQIKLVSLNANDMFTEEEFEKYMEVISYVNEIDRLETSRETEDIIKKKEFVKLKKKASEELSHLISQHKGITRKVRLESVIYHKRDEELPQGVTWRNLKLSKKIAEFESDMSRTMELQTNDHTFDKIIVKWKNLDLLEQLVLDGFTMDLLVDGRIIQKKYRYFSSSAGQLRTDKTAFLSEDIWEKIKDHIECGLTWEMINSKGGVNVNKMLAYWSLCSSASIPWPEFDIDKAIVIHDVEAEVTDRMLYIKSDYTTEDGIRTVKINHTDGAGMIDVNATIIPEDLRNKNFMFRGNYFKGLLSPFPFYMFCEEHGVKPVVVDYWGKQHDLIKEGIQVIFFESQFKLAKFYPDWDSFKRAYKRCGCQFSIAQFEEDYPPDKNYNYQMTQTLTDFTDEEIKAYTAKTHKKILDMAKNSKAMLQTLKASSDSYLKDKVALYLYPELLRDGYSRSQLKDIKKRMLLDAKSGAIRCKNKRLYAIPDWYGVCERVFLGIERPVGLLKKDEIVCRPYLNYEKADVLRSPHLYFEHYIAKINKDPEVYRWFPSDGIVTSMHSLVSRILQFDVDGDMLNVVVDPTIIEVAERNLKEYDVIPLFYDAAKASPEQISKEALFKGLKRAHLYSNIGEISNMLTRLWNRDKPDRYVAALLTALNNWRIDGAKTGAVNEYTNYPEVEKRVNKATGGPNGRMPHFFQFSKNGRRDKTTHRKKKRQWAKTNNSTMNRICAAFDDIGNINMNWAGVPAFNWQMLLSEPCLYSRTDIVSEFFELDSIKVSLAISSSEESPADKEILDNSIIIDEYITDTLVRKFGSLEICYPYIVKHLFADDGLAKPSHKQTFWRIFGDMAIENLKRNLENCTICSECGAKIPSWAVSHICPKDAQGFYVCIDCGKLCERINSRQQRCAECQEHHKHDLRKLNRQKTKREKEERGKQFTTFLQSH